MFTLASLITSLALLLYLVLTINVGRARRKYNVPVPQMSGDEYFERVLRVQQNTLEQLIFFLPALWLFSFYVSSIWGAILGTVWLVGRIVYAWGYYQAAEKRTLGFGISSLSGVVLLLGAIIGIVITLIFNQSIIL